MSGRARKALGFTEMETPSAPVAPSSAASAIAASQPPSPVPAPAPQISVDTTLAQLREIDFIRQHQIDALDRAFAGSTDQSTDIDRILRFFNVWPEKCRLIAGSDYYLSRNPQSAALRLAAIAGAYALGDLDRAAVIADDLIGIFDRDVSHALKARIAGRRDGLPAETALIDEAISRFPDSYMLKLYRIELAIQASDVAGANTRIFARRSRRPPSINATWMKQSSRSGLSRRKVATSTPTTSAV